MPGEGGDDVSGSSSTPRRPLLRRLPGAVLLLLVLPFVGGIPADVSAPTTGTWSDAAGTAGPRQGELRSGAGAGATFGLAAQVSPQGLPSPPAFHLELRLPGGREDRVPVYRHRGYPAFPSRSIERLGWERAAEGRTLTLRHRTGIRVELREGSPWVRWDGELLQLAHEVYAFGDDLLVPLQLLADLFPGMLPAAYRYEATTRTLRVETAVLEPSTGGDPSPPAPRTTGEALPSPGEDGVRPAPVVEVSRPDADAPRPTEAGARAPRSRVVVIDPGHGGDEPGAVGPGGTREKEIALAVGLALARELEAYPWIEVFLTRDRDATVPIWGRGEMATAWKGERPGVFVSIHANAVPDRPTVRGFETYFLSEARTEHERRVAAAENAPLRRERPDAPFPGAEDPFLAGILRDLITHDHQQWSAYLADRVQRELSTFHPGPDRGVKQGPFAVLTNALMPSVLVELGFITNRTEEQLMMRPDFHRDSAAALARAIRDFFDRYPPGGTG